MDFQQEVLAKLGQLQSDMSRLMSKKRLMSIPDASKHYGLTEQRLRILCRKNIIEGCYSLISETPKNKHYIIDSVKLDELLSQGGVIALQLRKYQKSK